MINKVERLCEERGLKLTAQRKIIAQVLLESDDHPDVEEVYSRANAVDAKISLATVYRTMKLFEEFGIVQKLEIGDGKSRYEEVVDNESHHHHLIDIESGKIIEFQNEELEILKQKIAHELGYKLIDHRLELYGVPIKKT